MKRTAKYVDALDTAATYRITRARTNAALYAALARAGWTWSPAMQRWQPAHKRPTADAVLAGKLAEAVGRAGAAVDQSLLARIEVLERQVRMLERALLLVNEHLRVPTARLFGIDLPGGTLPA